MDDMKLLQRYLEKPRTFAQVAIFLAARRPPKSKKWFHGVCSQAAHALKSIVAADMATFIAADPNRWVAK